MCPSLATRLYGPRAQMLPVVSSQSPSVVLKDIVVKILGACSKALIHTANCERRPGGKGSPARHVTEPPSARKNSKDVLGWAMEDSGCARSRMRKDAIEWSVKCLLEEPRKVSRGRRDT